MSFRKRVVRASFCVALLAVVPAHASNAQRLPEQAMEAVSARFDPATLETRVASRVTSNLCVSFVLPQQWQMGTGEALKTSLTSASGEAELELAIRSARDLPDMPQVDLPSRDAAYLQRDYENTLGQPAQAVSLASLSSGAARWTATWIDANLPAGSHALTVETFIVPLSKDWLLELSLDNVEARDAYNALVQQMLSSVTVKPECG
jgi:hypothetical protein